MHKIDPDVLAEKIAAVILWKDKAAALLGMQVDNVSGGSQSRWMSGRR
jgi:hypothetical protein